MARRARWTVEPGRHIHFDGQPFISIGREREALPVEADGITHLIVEFLNREGVEPDAIYTQHMGFPPRRGGSTREARPRPLISSQDTRKAERLIRSAAAARFGRGRADLFFEHGHWWAMVGDHTYDVVDAIPGVDNLGIDFEALD